MCIRDSIDAYGNEDLKKWIGNPPLDEKLIEKSINNGSKRLKEGIPYFWEKVILKKFSGPDIFFEKWKAYRKINPIINDEIIGASRILENEDWFIFIASQIEKTCLNLIENNTSKNNNKTIKKDLYLKIIVWKFSKRMGGKLKKHLLPETKELI